MRTISWPGSKYRVIDELIKFCPNRVFDVMCEPFWGTGALTLSLHRLIRKRVIIAEANAPLRNWWQWLFRDPHRLLKAMIVVRDEFDDAKTNRERFNTMRDGWNKLNREQPESVLTAGWLWCLIYASTNNLARFNRRGEYNQTWGRGRVIPDPKTIITEEVITTCNSLADKVTLFDDFSLALDHFIENVDNGATGLCYIDPPYILEAGMYDANTWNEPQLSRLMSYIKEIEERRVWWLYTDYLRKGDESHPFLHALSRFRMIPISSTRDARPTGSGISKEEFIILGSVVEERPV